MSEIKDIAAQGYRDPVFFCKWFLPHLFPGEIPWVHRGLLAILARRTDFLHQYGEVDQIVKNFVVRRGEGNSVRYVPIFQETSSNHLQMRLGRFTLIMLPRGFAKTTIAGVAFSIYEVVYQLLKFMIYVSEAGPHAVMQLNNVKHELSTNERIIKVFGNLKPDKQAAEKWTDGFFETTTGVAIAARGRGAQIRGLLHKGNRPQKIVVDDVEDEESVSTVEQREKTSKWAFGSLLPALPALDPTAHLDALGTLLHRESLLSKWMKDPRFTVVKMGARDVDGKCLWPENMDEEKLAQTKEAYRRAGVLSLFWLEYFNEDRPEESQKFKKEYFRYAAPTGPLVKAIYLDPAISEKETADFRVITVVGISEENGYFYVCDSWRSNSAQPHEMVLKFFEMAKLHRPRYHGFESNSFQAALKTTFREQMFRQKYWFEPIPITHTKSKASRIDGILQPKYASGSVIHMREFPELEAQLMDFDPKMMSGKDDDMDSLCGAIELLDPSAPMAASEDLAKDEMPPLEEEIGDDFRIA